MNKQEAITFAESLNKHSFTAELYKQVKEMLASPDVDVRNTGSNILCAFPLEEMGRRYYRRTNHFPNYLSPEFSDEKVKEFIDSNTLRVYRATYWRNGNISYPPCLRWERNGDISSPPSPFWE